MYLYALGYSCVDCIYFYCVFLFLLFLTCCADGGLTVFILTICFCILKFFVFQVYKLVPILILLARCFCRIDRIKGLDGSFLKNQIPFWSNQYWRSNARNLEIGKCLALSLFWNVCYSLWLQSSNTFCKIPILFLFNYISVKMISRATLINFLGLWNLKLQKIWTKLGFEV